MIAAAPPADTGATLDPELVAACGEQPSWVCETAWNITGSRTVATAAEWIVTGPLAALVIIGVASLLNRWLRKAVTALVTRATDRQAIAAQALSRVGISRPAAEVEERHRQRAATLSAVLRAGVSALVWSVAVLMVLGLFNISLAPLIASAGIAGIAIGFGAQSLVRDCLAGFFILLEDQFGVGDVVDLGPAIGTVETVTLRATVLRSSDGTQWSVPNGTILRVGNRSRAWTQMVIDVTVAPDADADRAATLLLASANAVCESLDHADSVVTVPTVIPVERVTTDGLVLRVAVRVTPGAEVQLRADLRGAIRADLAAADIPLVALADV